VRNQVTSSLVWLWWVIDLAIFEFEFRIVLFFFYLCFIGESRLLVSWCACGRYGMTSSNEDCGRSRRPGAEDRRWSHRSGTRWPGGWEVGWHRARSTPGTCRLGAWVSWLSLKTKVDGLWVVWPQNHSDGFRRFGLKTSGDGFWRFSLKTCCYGFCWFGHKTSDDGFSQFSLKTGGRFLGWASKLRWCRVFRFEP
jgi:hypothetical protein